VRNASTYLCTNHVWQNSQKWWNLPHILLSYCIKYLSLESPKLSLFPYNTHTHPFNGPFSGTTRVSRYQKGRGLKQIWILLKQETVSGSVISWVICKFAPGSRQITTPAPHHSVFTGRMPFLPPNQQCQSTEGTPYNKTKVICKEYLTATLKLQTNHYRQKL